MRRLTGAIMGALGLLSISAAGGAARAATLTVTVEAAAGPVADAVVSLQRPDGVPIAPPPGTALKATIDQRAQQFVPHVLAVEVGTDIEFPNSDNIRHDVYSFSPAKTFDLPLYSGMPPKAVRFDTPGIVVLGCNIHDWMLAFIDVVPTPYFAQTNRAGAATLKNVPAGRYALVVWAPRVDAPDHTVKQPLQVAAGDRLVRHVSVRLGAEPPHVHRPVDTQASRVIHKLEQKFGRFRQEPPAHPSSHEQPSG